MLGLAIYIFENNYKISVDCIIVGNSIREKKSQWTFDILDDPLLKNIIDQQLFNYNSVNTIVISSHNNKKYIGKDLQLYLGNLSKQKGINYFVESNINIATYGFNSNRYKFSGSDTLIGISIPRKHTPCAGLIINNEIYKGRYGTIGEIKNIMPHINWNNIKLNTIKEFLISVSELISPSEIIIYSNFINRLFLNRLSKELKIEIILKKSLKRDLEVGIVLYLNDKLNINKDSCMA